MLSSHVLRRVGWVVFLFVVLPVMTAPPEMARFTCAFRKKEDTFQVVTPKLGAETFRIKSVSGIGSATITCNEGQWPETVTVLFVGMTYLESFTMEGNGVSLGGAHNRAANPTTMYFNNRGEALANEKGSAYRLVIEARKDEGMRVTLTAPATAQKTKTWKLDWIDAFRR